MRISEHQVGQGANIVYPVSLTDRGISTAPYGTVINTLKAVTYSFSIWAYYEVIRARTLLSGGMVNPAGNIVFPTKAFVVSAASDFSSDDSVADLVLGINTFTRVHS